MDNPNALMDGYFAIFDLFMGAYFTYCAITKKGNIYKFQDIPDAGKPMMEKFMQIAMFIIGPLFLIFGIIELTKPFGADAAATVSKIMLVLTGVAMVAFIVIYKINYNRAMDMGKKNLPSKKAK